MTTKIENETVILDGQVIHDTEFVHCLLVYRGGTVPLLRNNEFRECTFNFEGSARTTLDFLKSIASGTGDGSGQKFVLEVLLGIDTEMTQEAEKDSADE